MDATCPACGRMTHNLTLHWSRCQAAAAVGATPSLDPWLDPTASAMTSPPPKPATARSKSCPRCGREFTRSYHLNRHILSCGTSTTPPTICEKCGQGFTRLDNLQTHVKSCRGPKIATSKTCEKCGREFARSYHLQRHAKICGRKRKNTDPLDPPPKVCDFSIGVKIEALKCACKLIRRSISSCVVK